VAALANGGMKRAGRREREVPTNECCNETTRIVIVSNPTRGGGRAARCAATPKDLDDEHAATAARARRAVIGRGIQIGGAVRRRRLGFWHWGGDQLPGTCDIGLTTGAGQQPVMADAVNFGRTWSRKHLMNSSALSVIVRYRACPLLR